MRGAKVLDSSALLAYFEGEKIGSRVKEILQAAAEKQQNLLLSVVNWGEILYVVEMRYGKARRDEIERIMSQMHLEIIPADQELTRQAARLKASKKLPYADSFAAALAILKKATLVTTDKDFKSLEPDISIEWLT